MLAALAATRKPLVLLRFLSHEAIGPSRFVVVGRPAFSGNTRAMVIVARRDVGRGRLQQRALPRACPARRGSNAEVGLVQVTGEAEAKPARADPVSVGGSVRKRWCSRGCCRCRRLRSRMKRGKQERCQLGKGQRGRCLGGRKGIWWSGRAAPSGCARGPSHGSLGWRRGTDVQRRCEQAGQG